MEESRLILYDTCNYRDYPVGGQVTSIKNFLAFLSREYPEHRKNILLVGVSCNPEEVGKIIPIATGGSEYSFLAVTRACADLGSVKKSLRLEYVKGLWKYRKLIRIKKDDCNYIHTPEAFGAVRFLCPGAVCYVFSHGTYLNMWQRVRFFKKAPLIRKAFQGFLIHVIKKSTAVFVLEQETLEAYSVYNKNTVHVGNSIIVQPYTERRLHEEVRFLYAGRLSIVKNVGPIIEAVKSYDRECSLTVLGDGEERRKMEALAEGSKRIRFAGAVTPDEVQKEMKQADVLVMNSTFEGIPMTILEAISLGLPVITTDVGGIKEVLTYGRDAEVTDGTVEKIHTAMDKILLDYEAYAEAAYRKSLQFDYRKVNRKVFDVINGKLNW
nr:glycosyltransferase family 4 protein [uncultured Eisenbergiella sp.]